MKAKTSIFRLCVIVTLSMTSTLALAGDVWGTFNGNDPRLHSYRIDASSKNAVQTVKDISYTVTEKAKIGIGKTTRINLPSGSVLLFKSINGQMLTLQHGENTFTTNITNTDYLDRKKTEEEGKQREKEESAKADSEKAKVKASALCDLLPSKAQGYAGWRVFGEVIVLSVKPEGNNAYTLLVCSATGATPSSKQLNPGWRWMEGAWWIVRCEMQIEEKKALRLHSLDYINIAGDIASVTVEKPAKKTDGKISLILKNVAF